MFCRMVIYVSLRLQYLNGIRVICIVDLADQFQLRSTAMNYHRAGGVS